MKGLAPIAISMGDPAGIGPEIIAKSWEQRLDKGLPPFIYIGCTKALDALREAPLYKVVSKVEDCINVFDNYLPVLNTPTLAPIKLGSLNKKNSPNVINAIKLGVELSENADCRALVTAPIHKAALYKAGFEYAGHTDFIAKLTGTPQDETIMMLASPYLKVVPVTVHLPIKDIPKVLTQKKIELAVRVVHFALIQKFGINNPRLAISGLNPHAGEDGTLGEEEQTIIIPAIKSLQNDGIDATGPHSADVLFTGPIRNSYDVAICMYHDQALVPLKTLDFQNGVNITLGTPIVRTSPDHGTALDIAGKEIADPSSMIAAIKMADRMSNFNG